MVRMLRRATRRTPIAIDVGHGGVRAVQLERNGEGWRVVRAARYEGDASDDPNGPSAEDLERRLRACLGQAEFHGRKVHLVLSSPDVECHALELPAALCSQPESQVAAVVRSEILRLEGDTESDNGSDVQVAHWTLPPCARAGPNTLGVAVNRGLIGRALQACDKVRLDCRRVDVAAAALGRLGAALHTWEPDEVWGVLDVGHRQTRLVLCVGEVPVLVRTAGTGGGAWTRRIVESLEISQRAAEIHKREHGLALPRSSRTKSGPGHTRSELGSMLFGALRSDLNALAAEVKRSYEYILSCYAPKKAADLVLVGGGAALGNLPEYLSRELGIPVRLASEYVADQSCRIRCDAAAQLRFDVLALATGMAIAS